MPINKAIENFNQTTTEETTDKYLIQRGESYFYIEKKDIGGGMYKISGTLSIAQLQAINTTPIEVIPAQGATEYIEFISGSAFRNGTAFTSTDPYLKFVWTGSTTERYSTSATFLTDVAATNVSQIHNKTVGNRIFANTGLSAYCTSDITTATGPVSFEIIYRVVTYS